MKRNFTLLFTVLICLFCEIRTQAQIIYYNNFNDSKPGWDAYDDAYKSARKENGKYILTHKQNSYSVNTVPVDIDVTRDFSIETVVTHLSGVNLHPIGITFGGQDIYNLYYFVISASGSFSVKATNKNVPVDIAKWTVSSAIKTGDYVPNKLRVDKVGTQMICYINDAEVYRGVYYKHFGNQVGVFVQNMQTAEFDNLTVSYINTAPVKPKVIVALDESITETVYHTDFKADDENEWVLKPTDSAVTTMQNGVFKIARKAKYGFTESVTGPQLKVDMTRDFLIETEAIHYGGINNNGYGIDFGCDSSYAYQFGIASLGYYYVDYVSSKPVKMLIPWTATDAIIKGDLSKNKLSVQKKGGNLNFYINNQLVDTYPAVDFKGQRFGVSVTSNQTAGFDMLTFAYLDHKQQVVVNNKPIDNDDHTPPVITITSPAVTRGLKVVKNTDVLHVTGTATDKSGIYTVVVNGILAKLDADGSGNFSADVDLAIGDNPLKVVATDNAFNKGIYLFSVSKENVANKTAAVTIPEATEAKYYALLIGVQNYQDQSIISLAGPVNDAVNLSKALQDNYTFAPENVTVLKDPTRNQIYEALQKLKDHVTDKDNVLLFYAGHGNWNQAQLQGYWYPADAQRSMRSTWLTNDDIIGEIRGINSKHTLLITDACFAGSILQTRGIEAADKGIQKMYELTSRNAMTSGTTEEVPDNSVFVKLLVENLNKNNEKYLPALDLFTNFRKAVTNFSDTGQSPQFGELKQTGHNGGDFIFIRK